MTGITTKLTLGLVSLAGGSAGIIGIHKATRKETIQEKLSSENKSFLNTQETKDSHTNPDDTKWTQKISSWSDSNSEVAVYIGSKNVPNSNPEKIQALKKKCKSELTHEASEERYTNFKKHCTEDS